MKNVKHEYKSSLSFPYMQSAQAARSAKPKFQRRRKRVGSKMEAIMDLRREGNGKKGNCLT